MSKFIPFYLAGGMLAISWAALPAHGPWDQWDLVVFHLANGWLAQSSLWADLVAITNNRLFDLAVLACMGWLLALSFYQANQAERRRLVAMGIVMLLSALVINQIGHLLPIKRPSPTLMVTDALRISQFSPIPTKDASSDSFPGDHALFLMIFAGFALRYLPRRAGIAALLMVPLFSAPRILVGAHWLTDVYVASLSLALLLLPPLLLTSLSDHLIARIESRLPDWSWQQHHGKSGSAR